MGLKRSFSDRVTILDIPIDRLGFFDALKKIEELVEGGGHHLASPAGKQVATVNPEFIMHSLRDKDFREALQDSSLNTADGIGTIWASKFLKLKVRKVYKVKFLNTIKNLFWLKITLLAILFNRKWLASEIPERVTGIDMMWELANHAQERGWKIYLLGAQPGIAEEVAEKFRAIYPRINIVGTYAGTVKEEGITERVAKTKPDILFVAFGSPKQEIFIHQNLSKLGAKVVIGVGGSFDFIVGVAKRAPKIFQKLGIEWLWRLFQQPKRVGRIINAFPRFVWRVYRSK